MIVVQSKAGTVYMPYSYKSGVIINLQFQLWYNSEKGTFILCHTHLYERLTFAYTFLIKDLPLIYLLRSYLSFSPLLL